MNLSAVDVFFVVVSVILIVRAAALGFVGEFSGVASYVLGGLAAFFFYKEGAVYLRERFMPGLIRIPQIVAFLMIFLAVFIVVKIAGKLLESIVELLRLRKVDHFLGALLGAAEAFAVVALIIVVISTQSLFNGKDALEKSFFARYFLPFIEGAKVPGGGDSGENGGRTPGNNAGFPRSDAARV